MPTTDFRLTSAELRHDWTFSEALAIYQLPLNDLLFQAHSLHRSWFDPNSIQLSSLLSIKTGACPEDCAYCPQSVRHEASVESEPLMEIANVVAAARRARDAGASRFCMGAAWRRPKEIDFQKVLWMVESVKSLGLETCVTLGTLTREQAERLKDHGLDYYNHNLDTSPEYYGSIITTRTYQERLNTLDHVREAGLAVCCGGIVGMGESPRDRVELLVQLANLPHHPESVPVNLLVRVEGTPLYGAPVLDPLEFVRCVALARVLMPRSVVRLSAGRDQMSDELHALCFFAGANSIFHGEKLLTTPNATSSRDSILFSRLGLRAAAEQGGNGRASLA
jgi:biotin synthase